MKFLMPLPTTAAQKASDKLQTYKAAPVISKEKRGGKTFKGLLAERKKLLKQGKPTKDVEQQLLRIKIFTCPFCSTPTRYFKKAGERD